MENIAKGIIDGNRIQPPEMCQKIFKDNFPASVNIDWFEREHYFEAVFYKDNIEHIAIYSKTGNLQEYKMILTIGLLPESIKSKLEEMGEIMNALLINKGNSINYEAIVRDKDLKRYLVLLTNLGKIISTTRL